MKDVIIRRMKHTDIGAVSRMESETFSQPWSWQGFADALAAENVIFLVAEAEEKIAGYCGIYCALDEGEITNVAVGAEFRRRGIGRQLMKQLLEEAKTAGITNVILEVRLSNENAIRLYKSMGFVIQGIRKDFYNCPKEDGYVMTLSQ